MSRYDQVKYHLQKKQDCIKMSRTGKYIGVLSSCIGIASTVLACASAINENSDCINTSAFSSLGAVGILMGIMFLRISTDALHKAKKHQKQIRKIQKQK